MDAREHKSFVDDLLDAALERRRSVEPGLGLEKRILANLRARPHTAPWLGSRRLEWAAAGVAAAVAIAATALYTTRRATAPVSLAPAVVSKPEALLAPSPPPAVVSNRPTPRHGAGGNGTGAVGTALAGGASTAQAGRLTPPEPRLERFPAPTPLSDQEKLLLKYVQSAPEPVLMAQIDRPGMQPLKIDDLTIPKLAIKELAGPENDETK